MLWDPGPMVHFSSTPKYLISAIHPKLVYWIFCWFAEAIDFCILGAYLRSAHLLQKMRGVLTFYRELWWRDLTSCHWKMSDATESVHQLPPSTDIPVLRKLPFKAKDTQMGKKMVLHVLNCQVWYRLTEAYKILRKQSSKWHSHFPIHYEKWVGEHVLLI